MLAADLLAIGIQANITTLLVAPPGVAKTAVTRAITHEIEQRKYDGKGFPFVVTNAAQGLAEDVGGGQVPNHDTKCMDAYAMGSIKPLITAKKGVHLCDEYGSSTSAYRAAMLSVNEGRQYGDHHLPGVSVVCIMNPPEIATNGQEMTAPESNRFFWVYWELDRSDYFDYMLGGKGAVSKIPILPKNWEEEHLSKAKGLIVSFLKRVDNKILYDMPAPEKATAPWPSNRSWENAAKMFAAVRACGYELASDHVHAAVAGCVGRAVADVFFAWVKDMDLPDPEEVLAHPERAQELIPKRHDRAIVCLESVALAAAEKTRPDFAKRWKTAWDILGPVIATHQDRAEPAAVILARSRPPGVQYPAEAGAILKIRRDLGTSRTGVT